jgi:hypothetical protein
MRCLIGAPILVAPATTAFAQTDQQIGEIKVQGTGGNLCMWKMWLVNTWCRPRTFAG